MNLERKTTAAIALALLFVFGLILITYFTYNGTRNRSEHQSSVNTNVTVTNVSEDNETVTNFSEENETVTGTLGDMGEKALWRRNVEHLLSMACTPRRIKVFVPKLLRPDDARMESVHPTMLSVPRCSDSNSFCGDEYGISWGTCKPGNVTEMDFTVIHYENSEPQYFTVSTEVHLTCECV